MTKEQMKQAVMILFETFPCQNKEGRLNSFYEFFSDREYNAVRIAARRIAEKGDKIPTNAEFAAVLSSVYVTDKTPRHEPVKCPHCDSTGIVHARDEKGYSWAYRCKCINGEPYKRYTPWFGEDHPGKTLDKQPEPAPF